MADNEEMIWTVGLRDQSTESLDRIMKAAMRLQQQMKGAFDGFADWHDAMDKCLDEVAKRLNELGVEGETQAKILLKMEEGFGKFVNDVAPASTTLADFSKALSEAGVQGKGLVRVMAPLAEGLRAVWEPTDKTAEVFDRLKTRLTEIGVPLSMYRKEMVQLEQTMDAVQRSGDGEDKLLGGARSLFGLMGLKDEQLEQTVESLRELTAERRKTAEEAEKAADQEARAAEKEAKAAQEAAKKKALANARAVRANHLLTYANNGLARSFLGVLNMMGLLPSGVSRAVNILTTLDYTLERVAERSNAVKSAMKGIGGGLSGVGGDGGGLSTKLLGFIKPHLGLAAIIAVLAAIFYGVKKYADQEMEKIREAMAKNWDDIVKLGERAARKTNEALAEEAKRSSKALAAIREETDAYNALANAKEKAAAARSDATVASLEEERAKWKREFGDASPEETAAGEAAFAYAIEQEKTADLVRRQAHERALEKAAADTRAKEIAEAEDAVAEKNRILNTARRNERLFRAQMPDESDIDISEGVSGVATMLTGGYAGKYKNQEEYDKALKEWRQTMKQLTVATKRAQEELDAATERSAGLKDFQREWAADADAAANELARTTAMRRQNETLRARQEAMEDAAYAADTALTRRDDAEYAFQYGLWQNTQTSANARWLAERKLKDAGGASADERARLETDVRERRSAEELANYRYNLARERAEALARTNDKLERERIQTEYEWLKTYADLWEKENAERFRMERAVHEQRVAYRREEANALRAQLADQRVAAGEAQSRLAAAQSQVARAWGWYRNKDSLRSQIAEWDADAEARRQYAKDYHSLTRGWQSGRYGEALDLSRRGRYDELEDRIGEWRRKKVLSVDEEATMRVALAKDEEHRAQKALDEINEAAQRTADAIESIEAAIAEGGD